MIELRKVEVAALDEQSRNAGLELLQSRAAAAVTCHGKDFPPAQRVFNE